MLGWPPASSVNVADSRVSEKVYQNLGNPPLLALFPGERGRVLDCGCGAGDNAQILHARGWKVTGITLSSAEQRAAAAFCERVVLANLEAGLPDSVGGPFDVVLMSHVLEHLVAPENLLDAVKTVLAPDGILAVALPNVLYYPVRLGALFGKFEYTVDGIMDETHVRFYTFETGGQLLRKNGYRVLSARGDGAFPLWKLRRLLPDSWVRRLNRLACRAPPGLFGRQSLYLARPAE